MRTYNFIVGQKRGNKVCVFSRHVSIENVPRVLSTMVKVYKLIGIGRNPMNGEELEITEAGFVKRPG